MQLLITFTALLLVFGFMTWSLHFSRYRRRNSSCCGGGCQRRETVSESCSKGGCGH